MPITNHVTSLELSRRLKELKVEKESYFVWVHGDLVPRKNIIIQTSNSDIFSAYLASELGEFIGNALENGEDKDLPEELQPTTFQDIWNPDYLAKLLIWLIENHLISVEELGK